jgi:hypothetical protein
MCVFMGQVANWVRPGRLQTLKIFTCKVGIVMNLPFAFVMSIK